MYIRVQRFRALLVGLCLSIVGCTAPSSGYEPLTHTASLRNIGKEDVLDAMLHFGVGGYTVGGLGPGVGAHFSRTGDEIPEYAGAEWRRADGSTHKGTLRIVKPIHMDTRERYVIQIDDDNTVSLKVEFPKPIQTINK